MNQANETAVKDENHVCLSSFKAHWAEAQIDGPMHAIERYDDVAKLLITIGGFVLAVLATMLRDLRAGMSQTRLWPALIFLSMLGFLVCAALVCYWQPRMWAREIMSNENDVRLRFDIEEWCKNIDHVICVKKWLLGFATAFFVVSFLAMMGVVLNLH